MNKKYLIKSKYLYKKPVCFLYNGYNFYEIGKQAIVDLG